MRAIAGINVTPLVDITLVLLIVFMVTARSAMSAQAIPMPLPKVKTSEASEKRRTMAVAIAADGALTLDGERMTDAKTLAATARTRAPDGHVVIAASPAVSHGEVIAVIDELRSTGLTTIAFAVTPGTPGTPVMRRSE